MLYKTTHVKLNKLFMLIAVLAMALLLCGCRTRISNNTEVASTITDDEGWMQELYQERRDELGIPVAKKPFFTGSSEEDIDGYDAYDSDMDRLEDYEDDLWEDEEFDEDDSDEPASNSSTTSPSTTSPRRKTSSTTIRRRPSTTPTKRRTSTTAPKKKPAGTSTDPNDTFKKKYTVSFDGDGVDMEGITITVEEGGTYGNLPNPPGRDDHTFVGWFTEKDGKGTEIQKGSSFTGSSDHTLYAYWTKEPFKAWKDEFDIAANEIRDNRVNCYVISDNDNKARGFVDECKGVSAEADQSPTCLIVFAKNDDPASDAYTRYHEGSEGIEPISSLNKAIVISAESLGDDKKAGLIYKILLLSELYGSFSADDINKAVTDLGIDSYYIDIYPPPNP